MVFFSCLPSGVIYLMKFHDNVVIMIGNFYEGNFFIIKEFSWEFELKFLKTLVFSNNKTPQNFPNRF